MIMAAGASAPPGDGKHFQVTFSFINQADGKTDWYGIYPGGAISRLKSSDRKNSGWVDTGVALPGINDSNR
jgi:hypothetical protein